MAVRYLAHLEGDWVAESRLRMQTLVGEHLPDGLWRSAKAGSQPVAVEVERNAKAGARWGRIIYDLLSRYHQLHYWLSGNTAPVSGSLGY